MASSPAIVFYHMYSLSISVSSEGFTLRLCDMKKKNDQDFCLFFFDFDFNHDFDTNRHALQL